MEVTQMLPAHHHHVHDWSSWVGSRLGLCCWRAFYSQG